MSEAAQDHLLINRIAAGDQAAIRTLFARYHLRLFRFILRFVKNEAVAEELANEVFLDIWRHAAKYEGRSSASTWLLAIARNRSLSYLRKRREDSMDDKTAERMVDGADTPEVTAQKTNKGALMRQCMQQLSPEHGEIIDLVYYHEKSINEVSEIVGIPVGTVKTRMFHARRKLSALLKEAGVDRGWP
ncbi:MAG: RNA polymerase subunit sigma [Hyphomicrobiales bacterium]|nr:MAG: RNA polymerase subunit sigma [Hyphomicrobiales bacterium]